MVPELNGKPILLTKNTSDSPKKASVVGSNNLKINNNMATDNTL